MSSIHLRGLHALSLTATLLFCARPAFADADLSITIASAGGVKPGTNLVYTIVVKNAGPDGVTDASVSDSTPAGLVFGSNTGDCATAFPCSLGPIGATETRTITATFAVPANYNGANPIQNMATVSSSIADNVPGNNEANTLTAVTRVAGFHTLPPCRVADTRGSTGVPIGGPALAAGASRTFPVRRQCGLPDNAIAVSFNVTVTSPTGAGDLRIYPGNTSIPFTSAINYISGQTRANNGIVPVGSDGSIAVQCDQGSGSVHFILDVNGYFAGTDGVPTPVGQNVRVRPAPEVEITFDNVTQAGLTTAAVFDFADNRAGAIDQNLRDFFPAGSPLHALLPDVVVPDFIKPLGKGGASGTPTFVLAIIDTTAKFTRTAEFHGLENFRLGWDPPCVVAADPTQEPRTFYAREAPKGEPDLVEEMAYAGPVFTDISSGCGSNKGSGWNFSLYLTSRDTRSPHDIALYMLLRMQDALTAFASSITNPTASSLTADVQAALTTLDLNPASSLAKVNDFIALVDNNPAAFDDTARNVSGELVGRALAGRYMIAKLAPLPSGTITEYPVSSSGGRISAGPDGNMWFANGRIATTGIVLPAFPGAGNGVFLGTDPAGNYWLDNYRLVTPAGAFTDLTPPGNPSDPTSIPLENAVGPDGNLWFTALYGWLGRITSAGAVTFTGVPTGTYELRGITTGPDGNLWFTETTPLATPLSNMIGRVTLSLVFTRFPVPTALSQPFRIATGPDGNLWFTERAANKVGRITTSGVITEFPTDGSPREIAGGPDGNVWFTLGNKIARITPTGTITEFPTSGTPGGIAGGPDGNVWFTLGNRIGRIVP